MPSHGKPLLGSVVKRFCRSFYRQDGLQNRPACQSVFALRIYELFDLLNLTVAVKQPRYSESGGIPKKLSPMP